MHVPPPSHALHVQLGSHGRWLVMMKQAAQTLKHDAATSICARVLVFTPHMHARMRACRAQGLAAADRAAFAAAAKQAIARASSDGSVALTVDNQQDLTSINYIRQVWQLELLAVGAVGRKVGWWGGAAWAAIMQQASQHSTM